MAVSDKNAGRTSLDYPPGVSRLPFEVRTVDFVLNLNSDPVAEAMVSDPLCIDPQTSVREVFERLKQDSKGGALVCREGVLVGIFTERDALRLMAEGTDLDQAVEQVMVADPVVLSREDSMAKAIRKMSEGGYRHLPIIDSQGRPVGMIKVSEVVHYLVEHFPQAVYNLPPEPHPTMQDREGA